MVLGLIGALVLSENMGAFLPSKATVSQSGGLLPVTKVCLQYGIPTVLVILLALFMFRIVNRQKSADFLIAAESEMKKVSWSNKKEIVGSTKVVIVTTFIMAAVLFAVDLLFTLLFDWCGILKISG